MDISFILDQTKLLLRTIVNPALSSLKGGALEIKLTVPLKKKKKNLLNTSVTMLRYVFERVVSL